jgi:hypothetical protein
MKSLVRISALLLLVCCRREATAPAPVTTSRAEIPPPPAPKPCTPAPNRLCPTDEAQHDPSFASYRAQLIEVVNAKDAAKLRTMISPKVRTSFGDDAGRIDDSPDSPMWKELSEILRLGGSFREGMFWAPYVYSNWPETFDSFESVAAIRDGVPVYAKADANSEAVRRVDWEILKLLENKGEWMHVEGGWVRSSDVRSPIGYRAGFMKESGVWKLNALVRGD